jgi:CubicO group peptidase (beta-lactamase class C family)
MHSTTPDPSSSLVAARLARAAPLALAACLGAVGATCSDPSGSPAPPGLVTPSYAAFDAVMDSALAAQQLPGAVAVVVHRDSGIVHLRGYGGFRTDRLFLLASASKPVSAGVVMRLADQGRLDVDAPIGTYVSGAWGAGKSSLTLAQMMSNSSGMVGLLDAPGYQPYLCQFVPRSTLADCARTLYGSADGDAAIPPDTRFRYGGAQWQLAGGVAAHVAGRGWADLVRETYAPCGVTSLGYTNQFTGAGTSGYPPDFTGTPDGVRLTDNPNIEGGGYATASDYARILLLHLREGRCGSTQVLSPAAVARMREDRIDRAYAGSTGLPGLQGYGLGWWIDRAHPGQVASPGFYGSMPWIDHVRGYGVFIALESDGVQRDQLWARVYPVLVRLFDEAAG